MSFFDNLPSSWQAGLIVIVDPFLQRRGIKLEMDKVYQELGVAHTSAYESARLLVNRMHTRTPTLKEERKKNNQLQKIINEKSFETDILRYRQENPNCWLQGERHQMTAEFKAFVLLKKKEYKLDWPEISRILGVSEDTLKKFKRGQKDHDQGGGGVSLPGNIVELLSRFFKGRQSKATVKDFCKKYPHVLTELKMSYREMSHLLWQLGFISPKGIFLPNTGLDRIERFAPHCIWGTDGKQMNIIINGEEFVWAWQCLVEYKTTVLVGGLIGKTETTKNLLEAIKVSREKTGVTPMAIVIDNRLSENLPAIRSYLDEMGIKIVKTFPGNAKSNGIVEGNFNIFEKWVGGKVVINGDNAEQLSLSIARMLTEVFTQLRNHRPRPYLDHKTPLEAMAAATPLTSEEEQTIREKIAALANRLKNEQAQPFMSERKEQAITQAIDLLQPKNPEVFRRRLLPSVFTAELILQALSIFTVCCGKHPENEYDHTYFGGILRNLVNQQSLEMLYTHLEGVYVEHWARMHQAMAKTLETPEKACERLSKEYLGAGIPAHGMLALIHLQAIFMMATHGCADRAQTLRASLSQTILKWKCDCHEKRQRLIRKLFEWEALTRGLAASA
jgi:hypothetical protein